MDGLDDEAGFGVALDQGRAAVSSAQGRSEGVEAKACFLLFRSVAFHTAVVENRADLVFKEGFGIVGKGPACEESTRTDH